MKPKKLIRNGAFLNFLSRLPPIKYSQDIPIEKYMDILRNSQTIFVGLSSLGVTCYFKTVEAEKELRTDDIRCAPLSDLEFGLDIFCDSPNNTFIMMLA